MQKLVISGEKKICGEISVQGAKNAALPLLAGCVLARGETVLHNCPRLSDVYASTRILTHLGCRCCRKGDSVIISSDVISRSDIPEELMREMRSSIVFLGAVIGRTGKCCLSFPGGCELGPRPIDMHISALRQMGVSICEEYGVLRCEASKGLHGAKITLSFPSVGATENVIMAAALAKGETVIRNAAREPEITDLADFLNLCGARIYGAGTSTVRISGVEQLQGCEHRVMPDRIVATTYLGAAAITGGEVSLIGSKPEDIEAILSVFEEMGCNIYNYGDCIYMSCHKPLKSVKTIRTMPYPGFPTDAQSIMLSVLSKAKGTSIMVENIFESRYRQVGELVRMGCMIKTEGKVAIIEGVRKLYGARVVATDLRGGAALVLAGLGAQGETVISNIKLIDRGYEAIEKSLSEIGADIRRITEAT
ncbi:MAG: UDP-N-acetylglucosamine 1-carboxyvinyltransferase [Ruminococcus sp.]|nr:UDP-N-acetylglucosamine 1-carboxyvinyltransferase [Ruminococcus sp.]